MKATIAWSAEIEQELTRLLGLEENISYEEIARRLADAYGMHFTKNACIGKARRMSMPPRPYKPPPLFFGKSKTPIKPDAPIPPRIPRRREHPDIYQLREGCCKWPEAELMDRPPYHYCGRPVTKAGGSWCPEHYSIVYTRPMRTWS